MLCIWGVLWDWPHNSSFAPRFLLSPFPWLFVSTPGAALYTQSGKHSADMLQPGALGQQAVAPPSQHAHCHKLSVTRKLVRVGETKETVRWGGACRPKRWVQE